MNYEALYPGTTHLLDPSYNFLGYRVPVGDMGATTSIQTANQLKEVNKLLNQGMKVTEVSIIQNEIFEMMPKDHLTEINRLNKLTGAESTIHAPLIEPSGVDTQQGGWSEEMRKMAEQQLKQTLEKSHELNPQGNIPVTIHASNLPGTEMIPEREEGKGPEIGKMVAIDQMTGKPMPLEREESFFPGRTKFPGVEKAEGEILTPEDRLDMVNSTQWNNSIREIDFYKKEADEIVRRVQPNLIPFLEKIEKGEEPSQEEMKIYATPLKEMERAERFMQNVQMSLQTVFEKAARFSDLDEPLRDGRGNTQKTKEGKIITPRIVLDSISEGWKEYDNERRKGKIKSTPELVLKQSQLFDQTLKTLGEMPSPNQVIKIEDFAKKHSSNTLSSVALHGFKKFGETAPIVSIENPPYGMAIASGKELKDLVERTRKEFVEKAIKDPKLKLTRKQAEKQAEKLIGVTWDTSHISMMRKQGFTGKDVTAETKEIAKYVKHLHYNDNFGTTHTDLPPGMGSLPMKDILNELEKGGFSGKRIFEGGNFFQHFQTSPFIYTLESGGSPIYSGDGGPTWNQLGNLGNYYSGHGPINTSIHHQTYGAGFQTLPLELGGEVPGGAGRFSGTPNQ